MLAMVPATPSDATKGFTNFRPLLTRQTLPARQRGVVLAATPPAGGQP